MSVEVFLNLTRVRLKVLVRTCVTLTSGKLTLGYEIEYNKTRVTFEKAFRRGLLGAGVCICLVPVFFVIN